MSTPIKTTIGFQLPVNPHDYDVIIVAFSGGKDSISCFLHLLDLGVDKDKIELWHHNIDGKEGDSFMDWPVTTDYCKKFASHFNVRYYESWKVGGFEKELMRQEEYTTGYKFETPDGLKHVGNGSPGCKRSLGKIKTVRKFPQLAGLNAGRWCSAYLKIMVMRAAIKNQERFRGQRTLVITGERGEESTARAGYCDQEVYETDSRNKENGMWIDQWRPIKHWLETHVWNIIERYGVVVPPSYYLGYSRFSCKDCIFGNADQWATGAYLDPEGVERKAKLEEEFKYTMRRDISIRELIAKGKVYQAAKNEKYKALAMNKEYTGPITTDNWTLPAGAYGKSCGPS